MAFLDTLFGSSPSSYDPTSGARNQLLKQYGGQLSGMENRPLHETLDPETLRFLETKAEQETRAAYPNAGRSGWLNDAVQNSKLKVRMAMLDQAIKNRTEMRNMVTQLAGQPSSFVSGQTGLLGEFGAGLAGRGGQKAADWLFGADQPKPGGDRSGGFSVQRMGEAGQQQPQQGNPTDQWL